MRALRGLFSLMRPLNVAIAFLSVVFAGLIAGAGFASLPVLARAGFAAVFLGAAGNILNDVLDVAIDAVNKPDRAIVSGAVSRAGAAVWAAACAAAGLLLSASIGAEVFVIGAVALALMGIYCAWLKRVPLVGNLAVAVVTGLAFLFGAAAAGNASAGIVPALFALFFNLAREVLKDLEDMEGDRAGAVRTYPLVSGIRPSLLFVSAMVGILVPCTVLPYIWKLYGGWYLATVVAGVDTVLVYAAIAMWRSPTRETFGRLARLLKYDMFIALFAMYVGTL